MLLTEKRSFLNRKSNKWKRKNIKLATNILINDKCLGFHKLNFKHVKLPVR